MCEVKETESGYGRAGGCRRRRARGWRCMLRVAARIWPLWMSLASTVLFRMLSASMSAVCPRCHALSAPRLAEHVPGELLGSLVTMALYRGRCDPQQSIRASSGVMTGEICAPGAMGPAPASVLRWSPQLLGPVGWCGWSSGSLGVFGGGNPSSSTPFERTGQSHQPQLTHPEENSETCQPNCRLSGAAARSRG